MYHPWSIVEPLDPGHRRGADRRPRLPDRAGRAPIPASAGSANSRSLTAAALTSPPAACDRMRLWTNEYLG